MSGTASQTDITQLFGRYATAFATRDADTVAALHSQDTRFWLHTSEAPASGRAAVREALATLFAQWPEFEFNVHHVITGQQHWILEWTLTATLTDVDGSPRPIRLNCLDVVTVDENGLVDRKDTFIDENHTSDTHTADAQEPTPTR